MTTSFFSSRPKYLYERQSYEFFNPSPRSQRRQASARSVVVNLVCTILGGGVLSVPYAFEQCGLIPSILILNLCGFGAAFTMYILVNCSRRSGAISYEEIIEKGFRRSYMQHLTNVMILLLTFFLFVAYIIFIKELAGTLVAAAYAFWRATEGPFAASGAKASAPPPVTLSVVQNDAVCLFLLLLISPVFFFRNLYALRYSAFLSLCCTFLLLFTVGSRIYFMPPPSPASTDGQNHKGNFIKLWPTNISDLLSSSPIFPLIFICHFNILSVWGNLRRPTRRRLRHITQSSVFIAWAVYLTIGLMGTYYTTHQHQRILPNIFNNFEPSDSLINVGRLGFIFALLSSLPLLLFPCRETFIRLITSSYDMLWEYRHRWFQARENQRLLDEMPADYTDRKDEKEGSDKSSENECGTELSESADQPLPFNKGKYDEVSVVYPGSKRRVENDCHTSTETENCQHATVTILIVVVGVYTSFSCPNVEAIWSFIGSTVALLIGYIFPCYCYLRIRQLKPMSLTKVIAYVLLFASTSLCLFCTFQNIQSSF